MAIAHVRSADGTVASAASISVAHTISAGSNRLLLVFVATRRPLVDGPTSVTFNGVAMSALTPFHQPTTVATIPDLAIFPFYLINPDVGTFNVVASLPVAQRVT